ncbi:MAG TPA: PD-(D/E)XK nuclease family protein [Candidatus Cybelea sp.]|nr:PD-(D/E)XK nuclease family protein [Candidatus Cybelea sp.]
MFIDDAERWHRTGEEATLLRMIRSPQSGVAHDIGAAYATLASRTGNLLDAIDRSALALPAPERDSVLRFASRARRVRALGEDLSPAELRSAITEAFAPSGSPFDYAQGDTDDAQGDTGYAQGDTAQGDTDEFELAEAIEPEEARGVAGWQRHFSASALNAYAECARKWFYRYACAAVEDEGSSASAYGTAFHLALEDFHGEFPRPRPSEVAAMQRRMREHVVWAFERNRADFGTRVEFELQVRRAQRTALRYIEWLLAEEAQAPFEVLGREVPANIEIEGRPFVGFIDRLDRDERTGAAGVVDYKTGSIATSAAEYAEKVRRFADFQLPFYYWARTAEGDRVAKLMLIPLKDALLDVKPIVLEVGKTIRLDELERSRMKMGELSVLLSSGSVEHFGTARSPSACTFCNYATACTKKPFPEPARFGS